MSRISSNQRMRSKKYKAIKVLTEWRALKVSHYMKRLTWDQALFSFRFENYIPAGKAKRKQSLIQTFYETSSAHFFDWLTFAESANQNYFRCLFF